MIHNLLKLCAQSERTCTNVPFAEYPTANLSLPAIFQCAKLAGVGKWPYVAPSVNIICALSNTHNSLQVTFRSTVSFQQLQRPCCAYDVACCAYDVACCAYDTACCAYDTACCAYDTACTTRCFSSLVLTSFLPPCCVCWCHTYY